MRRLPLIVLRAPATALSLTFCVAITAVWVRSYWVADPWTFTTGGGPTYRNWTVIPWAGGVCVSVADNYLHAHNPRRNSIPVVPGLSWNQLLWGTTGGGQMRYGFGRITGVYAETADGLVITRYPWSAVVFPLWLPAAAFAALPLARFIRALRTHRRRLNAGLCPDCGYDLRATPDRCPECGLRTDIAGREQAPQSPDPFRPATQISTPS